MISYEDLVYALTEWRARKGLPTNNAASSGVAAAGAAPAARAAAPAPMAAPARRSAPVMAAAAAPAQWAPDPAGQEFTYQNDDIAIEGEYSEAEAADASEMGDVGDASDAMSFDSMRPSTQPGFAPVAGAPGTRR